MSVLIKGMEMPTSCDDCRLNNGISCYAVLEYTEDGVVGRTDDRPDWCPLVPVQPHGRLIDADALKAKQQEDADLFIGSRVDIKRRDEALNAVANIVNAPTIIPAEEGE